MGSEEAHDTTCIQDLGDLEVLDQNHALRQPQAAPFSLLPSPSTAVEEVETVQPFSASSTHRKKRTVESLDHEATQQRRKLMKGTKKKAASSDGETFEEKWNRQFELLRAFQIENGHCRVPHNFEIEGINLGKWISRQRTNHKKILEGKGQHASITQQRIDLLNSIGFEWSASDTDSTSWNGQFELLRQFKRENTHCRVPMNFEVGGVQLGKWVSRQRTHYKNLMEGNGQQASITQQRIDMLNSIGFQWNANETAWDQHFKLLRAWQHKNGNCRVPHSFVVEGVSLGKWISRQRTYYKNLIKGHGKVCITQERIDQLNSIGFEWRIYCKEQSPAADTGWNQNFQLLQEFYNKTGHFRVPSDFEVGSVKLGVWVQMQRKTCHKGILPEGKHEPITQEHIDQLNSIGFDWNVNNSLEDDETWNQKFELLRNFHVKNGHCRLPQSLESDSVKLGEWVQNQRKYYQSFVEGKDRAAITQGRIDRLNSIDFDWSMNEETWNWKFALLCAFQGTKGHCRVPKSYEVKSVKLGHWVREQRKLSKRSSKGKSGSAVVQKRIDKLNSIGFEWSTSSYSGRKANVTWSQKFELLCDFHSKNGHCRVPESFQVETIKLGQWVKEQRKCYKSKKSMAVEGHRGTTVTQDRIAKLNSICFEWEPKKGRPTKEQQNIH